MRINPSCLLVILLLLITAGCSTAPPDSSDRPDLISIYQAYPELKDKRAESAEVARVVDGDTFETASGDKVRLIGVDTPEVYGKAEYYGKEASAYSKATLSGKRVLLFQDISETDRYGRLLRYVFLQGESTMFNERLLAEGYANPATFPPDVLYADRFKETASTARADGKGLWAIQPEEAANPAESPAEASTEDSTNASCENPQIKGNINSRGDRIYHVPGSSYYKQTIAEQMFCTEDEAIAAGFRKPGEK